MHEEPSDTIVPLSEQDAYAEHRAALDATLFATHAPIVLELRDGAFERRG